MMHGLREPRLADFRAVLLFGILLSAPGPLRAEEQQSKASATPPDIPALLKTASEALDRKDFAAAAKALEVVVREHSDMPAAWFNLGYAYSGLNQSEDAVRAYQRALQLQPELFEAQLNLGILLIQMKRAAEAVPYLEKAVSLKPQHTRAHLYCGRALNISGQPDAAEKEFQEALKLDPSLAIGYFDLGQLYLGKKDFEKALASFQKAAETDPQLAQAELGMALALEGLKRAPEASAHFEKYLAAQPGDLESRFHLARVYLQEGNNEKALENLQTVYQGNPRAPGVTAALGDVCALLKRFAESEKYYRLAVAETPNESDLHRALAQTLLDQQKFPEAEAEFRAALNLDSRSREAANGLATSLYLQKRYPEALPLFEQLSRAPDAPAGVFFVLATCYDHLRDLPSAIKNYERFLELSHGQSPDQEWQARERLKPLRRELRK
ncbi:MAG: tetratricopeptide repeat protein [Terriglobia bacterium]